MRLNSLPSVRETPLPFARETPPRRGSGSPDASDPGASDGPLSSPAPGGGLAVCLPDGMLASWTLLPHVLLELFDSSASVDLLAASVRGFLREHETVEGMWMGVGVCVAGFKSHLRCLLAHVFLVLKAQSGPQLPHSEIWE